MTPHLPPGYAAGSKAFDLSVAGTEDEIAASFAFMKPIAITVRLSTEDLVIAGGDAANVLIQHYRDGDRGWEPLPTTVDFSASIATAQVDHLSIFALTIKQPPPAPTSGPTQAATPTSAPVRAPSPSPESTPMPTVTDMATTPPPLTTTPRVGTYPNLHTAAYSYPNARTTAYSYPNADPHASSYPYTSADAYANAYAHPSTSSYLYTSAHTAAYANAHPYTNSYPYTSANPFAYAHHADPDAHAHACSGGANRRGRGP